MILDSRLWDLDIVENDWIDMTYKTDSYSKYGERNISLTHYLAFLPIRKAISSRTDTPFHGDIDA